ncbi:MAG: hypothetical protein R2762_08510 [Bryobacteraceae bacterium]
MNGRNTIAYDCDCNNVAPQLGLAWWRTRRSARPTGLQHYGQIFPVTFQQVIHASGQVVTAPDLLNPLIPTSRRRAIGRDRCLTCT